MLPALVAPLRAEIRADGAPTLSIEGRRLAVHFTVTEANAAIGAIEGAPLSRHYEITVGKERITLQGSFFNRTEFALLQDGARVGYIQVMRAEGPFESLISGSDSRLHLELPADLSFPLRQVLLGAMLVIDDRHF